MPEKLRRRQRITIPGAIKKIEEQTDGQMGKEHWFPVPCASQITDFIEALKEEPKYRLSIHFACGMATYVFKDGDKMIPLPKFFDIEGFFNYLGGLTSELQEAKFKKIAKAKVLAKLAINVRKFVDNEHKPKNLNFVKMLTGAMTGGNYHGLADLHHNSLFIGMMHFQDPYNWDIDRIHKCDIHYASPDGKITPFCTFNVIPELYRDKIQRKFSIPASEWEKKTGKKLMDDKHHRKFTPEEIKTIVGTYNQYRKTLEKPKDLWTDWGNEPSVADQESTVQGTYTGSSPLQTANPVAGLVQILSGANRMGVSKRPTMESPSGGCCGGKSNDTDSGGCGCG